ncbi:pentatricopeptide repeat-containing protein At5g50280, chloroplastic [Impatiens glandulifera]|uniref:pentatricopeptide repeat-containing protein At5g50280, chloroplastic n=1 Tax=Impatiens glandulifera TaxID=253017 RepID=UPI001FB12FAC|nr:pentatricopeptide repeat-containing protein At5g50280, chloroplastic [Impatiens glandulifera]XP_047310602.1 pentatricopeptide repeat-containing protein At5g50280, chloroplastic [Impatiens glandulifera]
MSLRCHCSNPSPVSLPPSYVDFCNFSRFQLISNGRRRFSKPFSFSISATPDSTASPIFLPFLQQQHQEEDDHEYEEEEEADLEYEEEEEEIEEDPEPPNDPLVKFFKFRASTQDPDPGRQGKFSLQKNRRTSWHLAPDEDIDEVEETQFDPPIEPAFEEEQENLTLNSGSGRLGVVAEIMRLARNVPDNSTLGEELGSYERKIGERECVEVLRLMVGEGLIVDCLYFFEWMRLQKPSLVTPRSCSVLFPALGRAGMGQKLLVLFRNLPDSKQFLDVHIFNATLSGLLCCGSYEEAWSLYETMETKNLQVDHVTCSTMITIIRKSGRSAKDAWKFFERINNKRAKWSLEVVGALIKSLCDEGLIKEALIVQLEMEKKGISSNAIIYNTLLDNYRKSNQIEEAEGLFAEMKAKGIKPTTSTFNTLINAYSQRMQPEIIEELFSEMENIGLKPDVKSYTCLISAYGRQKKMSDKAADAFLRMKKVGIKPTSHSYTALIHAYSISGWHEKAYLAFENMKREGVKPSTETYTALLDAFRRAGDAETLMKIWKLMISEKIEGTRVTFNILVDGFAKQGEYSEARNVISEFGKIGLQPTVMTYNMLINGYARGGQHLKLPQLLKEMSTLNLKPDSITYSTMIYAFVRVRDFKRAFFYHKCMVKSGQIPDVTSYRKLRSILEVEAKTNNRKDQSAILGIVKSKMGFLKDKKKGKKDEFWKNKTKRSRAAGTASKVQN